MDYTPLVDRIELHYFFTDESHSMDAYIRNKCEYEILAIIKEVSLLLDIKIHVDTAPFEEGGLREKFLITLKNQWLAPVVTSILSSVCTYYLTTDHELDELKKYETILNIKKLEREANEYNRLHNTINIEDVSENLNKSLKITKHKSNFYKTLDSYNKVSHVSLTLLNEDDRPAGVPKVVDKGEFDQFILESDKLPSVIDEEAVIEVVSPVLKRGKYKWKGIYDKTGDTIDFYMKDTDFKQYVFSRGVSFKNGSRLDCVLDITRRITEFGEIKESSFAVLEVHRSYDGVATIETVRGKERRNKKDNEKRQLALFAQDEQAF